MSAGRVALGAVAAVVATLVIEWVLWSSRPSFDDFGAFLAPIELGLAGLVAMTLAPRGRGAPSPWSRFAMAGLALVPSAAVVAAFGALLARNLALAPDPYVGSSRVVLLPLAAGALGCAACLGLSVLARRWPFLPAAVALAGLGAAVALLGTRRAAAIPWESVRTSLGARHGLESITIESAVHEREDGLVYRAIGSDCQVLMRSKPGAASVTPSSTEGGSAECPPVELRETEDGTLGAVRAPDGTLVPVFDLSARALMPLSSGGTDMFGVLGKIAAKRLPGARPIGTLPALKAPPARHGAETTAHDVNLIVDGSSEERCKIELRRGGESIWSTEAEAFISRDVLHLCPSVDLHRSPALDVTLIELGWRSRAPGWLMGGFEDTVLLVNGVAARPPLGLEELRPAPPRAWSATVVVCLALASALLLWHAVALISTGKWRHYRRAHHLGDGLVETLDGRSARIEKAHSLPSGPVLVRGELPERESAGGYRDGAEVPRVDLEVVPGSPQEIVGRALERARLAAVAAAGPAVAALLLLWSLRSL